HDLAESASSRLPTRPTRLHCCRRTMGMRLGRRERRMGRRMGWWRRLGRWRVRLLWWRLRRLRRLRERRMGRRMG
ncbi:hypothetical protein PFISCL1PPCAC_13937, partial [Pristionchus fissidentatus]